MPLLTEDVCSRCETEVPNQVAYKQGRSSCCGASIVAKVITFTNYDKPETLIPQSIEFDTI